MAIPKDKTLVDLLDEAHQKVNDFVMAVESGFTSYDLKMVDEALDNIMIVRNHLGELKKSVQEIIDTCSTRI